jgi:glutathione S-transferase
VPVLHDGDLTVWDSLAICEYADETWLDRGGWPRDPAARAVARSVSAEMHSGFQALRSALPFNCRRRVRGFVPDADARRNIERVCAIWRDCRARHGGGGAFLFGAFSIADAMYAPVVLRFETYGVALQDELRAYADALLGLPALQEWLRAAAAETETLARTDNVA